MHNCKSHQAFQFMQPQETVHQYDLGHKLSLINGEKCSNSFSSSPLGYVPIQKCNEAFSFGISKEINRKKTGRIGIPLITFYAHHLQNGQNKWTKILTLETTIFGLKMMVKSGLEKNIYFEIPRAPSEINTNSAIMSRFFCTGQQL